MWPAEAGSGTPPPPPNRPAIRNPFHQTGTASFPETGTAGASAGTMGLMTDRYLHDCLHDADDSDAEAFPAPDRAADRRLEETILALLAARAETSTICPSDAARAVAPEDWRPLMEPARQAAARLVGRGEVEITQHGLAVDPAAAKGPIRIRRTG